MKYIIDDAVAEQLGLTLPQVLALMLIKTGTDIKWILSELLDKEAIIAVGSPPTRYMVTQKWNTLCDNIIRDSDTTVPTANELEPLALKLIEIFPKGRKPATPYYWRGNKREVILRLKSFFKLYGNKYTEEQIINAARDYVDTNKCNPTTMRILKYFIWKKVDGEEVSDLATCIDNAGQEYNCDSTSWVNELK